MQTNGHTVLHSTVQAKVLRRNRHRSITSHPSALPLSPGLGPCGANSGQNQVTVSYDISFAYNSNYLILKGRIIPMVLWAIVQQDSWKHHKIINQIQLRLQVNKLNLLFKKIAKHSMLVPRVTPLSLFWNTLKEMKVSLSMSFMLPSHNAMQWLSHMPLILALVKLEASDCSPSNYHSFVFECHSSQLLRLYIK